MIAILFELISFLECFEVEIFYLGVLFKLFGEIVYNRFFICASGWFIWFKLWERIVSRGFGLSSKSIRLYVFFYCTLWFSISDSAELSSSEASLITSYSWLKSLSFSSYIFKNLSEADVDKLAAWIDAKLLPWS